KILVGEKHLADLFEASIKYYDNARSVANWIVTDLKGYLERYDDGGGDGSSSSSNSVILAKVTPKHIAELAMLVDSGKINRATARQILQRVIATGMLPSAIVQSINVDMLSNKDELASIVDKVIEEERKAFMDALSNEKALNYLLGKVMRYSNGRADPKLVLSMLKERVIGTSKTGQ
ncbi:MAG: hypothetical protein QXG53_03955, partial [Candidatus Nitrosocaldus sp.]